MLNKQHALSDLVVKIAREFHPEQIVLFGSYAYGNPTEASDMDLLIVMPFQGTASNKALEIMRKLKPRIPVDFVVRTPEDFV